MLANTQQLRVFHKSTLGANSGVYAMLRFEPNSGHENARTTNEVTMSPDIRRLPASAAGRSRASICGSTVWLVANAANPGGDFRQQVDETLSRLDATLRAAGSDRSRLLSVQVLLRDIAEKPVFDAAWLSWIGPDPSGWPQRSCVQAGLSPGLLVEVTAVAALASE
jgi:enamine deaminase RidA (YjgF/YER057c/UK114 family)